nr:reverse transcriptase domain-containing protein [Tanacetum cinerariifolium]
MSTDEQTPLSQPTSAVRNTLGREQAPQNLVRHVSDEDLREYCDKNYHQILPIIAENLHKEKAQQEKLKAVKARLNFKEASQYSESETPNRRRNLNERLGPRKKNGVQKIGKKVCFIGWETRRRMSPHIQEAQSGSHTTVVAGTQKAATKVLALKEQKLLSRNIVTKESIREEWKQCQKVKEVQEGTGSQNQRSKSQVWRTTYPNLGSEDLEDHLKIFQAAAKTEFWAMPTWCQMFNSTLTGNARVWFDDLPKESIDNYDDLRKAFLENYLQQKKCIKDPVEIHNIKQRNGESTEEFVRRQIEEMLKAGKLSHLIKELKQNHEKDKAKIAKKGKTSGKDKPLAILMEEDETEGPMIIKAEMGGHCVHRIYVDGGSSLEILYEHCFSKFCPEIKSQLIPANTPLVGFSGEIIWPLGQISLLVKIGDEEHSTTAWMNFMVVRSPSPYNGIIRSPRVRKIRAIPSTVAIHPEYPEQTVAIGSTLTEEGRKELCGLLRCHLDVFAWKPEDMTRVPRHIAKHRLNVREGCLPVRQKKRGQAPERNKAISEEVNKLVEADIMKEVHYHNWLSNPVMVKKHDDCWRMCVDFKDLNKACLKDGYPLPKIDWMVESLCGYPYKCFLDAYKGYHQIKIAEKDEENMAFITSQRILCYSKKPSDQRHRRNVQNTQKNKHEIKPQEVCLWDEGRHLLRIQRDVDGLRVSPNKVKAVLDLPSLKCLKDVQKLNGKLASLNRFLSKPAEKSLPFFKTLKKCTEKSDFQWTPEAEGAFKEMKQSIAKLSMLTEPKEKEELIMYLAAAKEAINVVLMTERDGKQVPVYFVSCVLQGPEINYTLMEKLIIALISASKRLKIYFHAHTIVVITDQPIKQLLSNPGVTERLLKWRFKLREYDIQYRPKTSVKGKILADFIMERPEDDVPDTPMEDKEELPNPWILFTDGSSCIDGSRAGLIITNPEGIEFTYALRFRFNATNNEAEYEALIASLRIARQMGKKAIDEKKILAVVEEEGHTWMTPVYEYLTEWILHEEKKKARTVRRKAGRYAVISEVLYKKSFLGPWLRCVGPLQENYVLREIHEGSCSMHAGPRFVVAKALRSVIPAEIGMPTLRATEVDTVKNNEALGINLDLLEEKREQAAIQEARNKDKMEGYYNARVRSTSFRPGDFVYRSNKASHVEDGGKLGPK